MSECSILPVAAILSIAAPAASAAPVKTDTEGELSSETAFNVDEVPPEELAADTVAADVPLIDMPPQDRLQMLIEDLSGITSSLREAQPAEAEATTDHDWKTPDIPERNVRIALAAPPEPLPAPDEVVQAEVETLRLDSPVATTAPLANAPLVDVRLANASVADVYLADAPLIDAPLIDARLADVPLVDPLVDPLLPDAQRLATVGGKESVPAPTPPAPPKVPITSISQQIAEAVVTAREDRIEVVLAPEELGRIRMVMSGPEHSPHVLIWAERPEVLDQLRRNASFLQECFGDAGMADASFEFQGDGSGGSGGRQSLPDGIQQGFDVTESVSVPLAWAPLVIPARLDIRI